MILSIHFVYGADNGLMFEYDASLNILEDDHDILYVSHKDAKNALVDFLQ